MARRNPNVSVSIDLEADAGSARKDIGKDLDKIERDAKATVDEIEGAFARMSPELDTSEIRKALDLAGQLDGMVAEFTVDTDLEEIKQAEAIARSLRSFQGRVDLSVEGRAELADALDLAGKLDQIRKVKVEVQGREDLEKAADLADDLERKRTVKVDVDDSEISRVGDKLDDELSDAGERGAAGIADHLGEIDYQGIGASGLDQLTGSLTAAGPWGAAGAAVAAVFADDFLEGFQDRIGGARAETVRSLRYNLSGPEMAETGAVAGELFTSGIAEGMSRGELRSVVSQLKSELGTVDDDLDLEQVSRQALALSEVFGVELVDSVAAVDKMVSQGLVPNSEAGFNLLFDLAQQTGDQFDETLEVATEFGAALTALGIQGPQGMYLIGQAIEQGVFPQVDQAGEVFEEFRETLVSGGANEALEELELNARAMQEALADGRGAEVMSTIAKRLLEIEGDGARAALAAEIFGGNMALVSDPKIALELFAQADGLRAVGDGATYAADELEGSRTNLDAFQRGISDGAGVVADGLNTAVGALAETVAFLTLLDDGSRQAVAGADALSTAAREGAPALSAMGTEADELAASFEQVDMTAEMVKAGLESLTNFGFDQSLRDIRDAADQLAASFADGNAKLVGYGGAIDTTTTQGRTLQSQFEQLTSASIAAEVAYANGEITSLELARAQAEVGNQFDRVTGAAGLTQVQVDGLRAKYLNLPSQVTTTLTAIDQSTAVIQNLQRELGALPTSKTITITTRNVIVAAYAASTQSREGRASGGPVEAGEVYEVGEMGRELFVPGEDGQIVNARDTRALLAGNAGARAMASGAAPGGGGGGGRAVLELRSSGSDTDEFLIRMMRKAVRNRGGIDVVFS